MPPTSFQQVASSSLSLPPQSYIYSLVPIPAALAAISSDDSLRLFDRETLQLLPSGVAITAHQGITCLTSASDELLASAGRDGIARTWDVRYGKEVSQFSHANTAAITALAFDPRRNCLIAGTELAFAQASIIAWDLRASSRPLFQYVESHNDDVTELQIHPAKDNLLLSGSTDGLVNIYNTSIQEEEDALYQVINHGSVHHAGFVSNDMVYALSHDESFAIHPLNSPDDDVLETAPVLFGDLRPPLDCDYAIQVVNGAQGPALAIGSHADPRVDLVPVKSHPAWTFDRSETIRLPTGHGEEVVRSVYVDGAARSIFTAGEDGFVRVWREQASQVSADAAATSEEPVLSKPKNSRRHQSDRYKPY